MSVLAPGLSLRSFARPLAIAVFLLLFAATVFLGVRNWRERQAAYQLLAHSGQVLDTLDRLRIITADLEAERRGYLQTLDPAYIKAYGISDARVRRDVQALQALVKNDPLQSLRADHLALTVSTTLRETDDMVKTARTSGLAALAMIRNMDEIRSQIDQMVDNERFLLVDQEARADSLEQGKTWLIAAAIVMITALAAAALAFARLEARQRRRTTDENVQLHRDLEERNRRIRRLFDSDIIGIMIWDLEGRILDANDAFLRMVGYDREDLASGRLHRSDLTPPEWRDRDERTLAELKMLGSVPQFEKEYFRKDGSRLPVLIGAASFEDTENQGVAFVLDLTERKQAEAEARENERRYREIQMDLAHANRVATMGQLTASIAHEVNQPVTATIGNAQAALRWLAHEPPNLGETRQLLDRISKDGRRASDVVGRIRDLTRKAPPRMERLDVNEAILEVTALTRGEVVKNGVLVRTKLADDLPFVQADRVQVQQVVLNLIMNAVEAMTGVDEGARELLISTGKNDSKGVVVSLQDSGPGLDPRSADQIFEAFYTTKSAGMGMGLAICRSIIEAHGGRMWAGANEPRGAVFQFTLPPEEAICSGTREQRRTARGPDGLPS